MKKYTRRKKENKGKKRKWTKGKCTKGKSNKKKKKTKLSFAQIKKILGFDIDHSFLTYKKELKEYGYEVSKISMKEKIVYINKI